MKKQKIVLTGGNGFIGANLAERFLAQGHSVSIIVRPQSSLALLQNLKFKIPLHYHDGTFEDLNKILAGAKPDVVVHLASLFLASHKPGDIKSLVESNISFGTQLLEAMALNNINFFVNAGTSWEHFENNAYNPVCLYAATKKAFEDILVYYTEASNIKAVTLKLFDTYGPGDPRAKLVSLLINTVKNGSTLSMSPGRQVIDMVYISDVVDAFCLAVKYVKENIKHGCAEFAVPSPKRYSLKQIVEIFNTLVNGKLQVDFGSKKYRDREVMAPWSKGKKIPGYKPKTGLKKGLLLCLKDAGLYGR